MWEPSVTSTSLIYDNNHPGLWETATRFFEEVRVIIIEKWKEPPVFDTPDPKFGKVIRGLNELFYLAQDLEQNHGAELTAKLNTIASSVNAFRTLIPTIIQPHLDAKGAMHGETKKTIGLDKVDNYRTGTVAEQRDLVPVDALVTPQGVQAAADKNNSFRQEDYQKNDLFPFGSLYAPNFYPRVSNNWNKVPYFTPGICTMGYQNDRVTVSPKQDATVYPGRTGFLSDSLQAASMMLLNEQPDMAMSYLGEGWGMRGTRTSDGKVSLFRPQTFQGKYNYSYASGLKGSQVFVLWDEYITDLVQGMGVGVEIAGSKINITHDVFTATNVNTDPSLVSMAGGRTATLSTLNGSSSIAINGSHQYDISDFVNLYSGYAIAVNTAAPIAVSPTLLWAVQDREIYLHIAVPVVVTGPNGYRKEYVLRFTESWIVQGINNGNAITVTQLGTLIKDTVVSTGAISGTAKWLMPCDWTDALNPVGIPGVFLKSGYVVQAKATKYGIKVKYSVTPLKSTLDWVNNYKTTPKPTNGVTRTFSPGRYLSFGEIPERIIPVVVENGNTHYLCYQDINKKHGYGWTEHTWFSTDVLKAGGTVNDYSAKSPDNSTVYEFDEEFNKSLVIKAGQAGGIDVSGMAFTFANNYTGRQGFSYNNGVLVQGTTVTVGDTTLSALRTHAQRLMTRADQQNGTAGNKQYQRQATVQIYCFNNTQILVVNSDGLSYVEAGFFNYQIKDGVLNAVVPLTDDQFTQVSLASARPNLGNRESSTGDGVNHSFADLLVYQVDEDTFHLSVPRAFGDVFGDCSFTLSNYRTLPTFAPATVNPARLYSNDSPIDVADELYPSLLTPGFGLFSFVQTTATETQLVNVKSMRTLDPYLPPDAFYCVVPSGTRCILGGRSFTLDRSYYLGHDGNGEWYFYLTRVGNLVTLEKSATPMEPSNNSVLYAKWSGGQLAVQQAYVVLDDHMLSYERHGASIPLTHDTGDSKGSNIFFRYKDVLQEDISGTPDYGWVTDLLAGGVQFIQYDTNGNQRGATNDFNIGFIDIKFNAAKTLFNPYLVITDAESGGNGGDYFSYSLDPNGTYGNSLTISRAQIAVGETIRVYVRVSDPHNQTKRVLSNMSMRVGGNWNVKTWTSETFGYRLIGINNPDVTFRYIDTGGNLRGASNDYQISAVDVVFNAQANFDNVGVGITDTDDSNRLLYSTSPSGPWSASLSFNANISPGSSQRIYVQAQDPHNSSFRLSTQMVVTTTYAPGVGAQTVSGVYGWNFAVMVGQAVMRFTFTSDYKLYGSLNLRTGRIEVGSSPSNYGSIRNQTNLTTGEVWDANIVWYGNPTDDDYHGRWLTAAHVFGNLANPDIARANVSVALAGVSGRSPISITQTPNAGNDWTVVFGGVDAPDDAAFYSIDLACSVTW